MRWGGCNIGAMSCVSKKAMDRFQCIWVTMIGEMYELVAEYLGNGFRQEPASYIENGLSNQAFLLWIEFVPFDPFSNGSNMIRSIQLGLVPCLEVLPLAEGCWR